MRCMINVDYLLEIEHLERCGSSVTTSSHLNGNKLRLHELFVLLFCSELCQMQELEVTPLIRKQLWKFPTVVCEPIECLEKGKMSYVCSLRLSC